MYLPMPFFWAYVDPVSGTILLQVIIAAVIGTVAYFCRPFCRAVRAVLGTKCPDNNPPKTDDES